MDVRAVGWWTSAPKCLFFSRISRAWPNFLSPDVRRDICVDVCRISNPKTCSLGCLFVPDFREWQESLLAATMLANLLPDQIRTWLVTTKASCLLLLRIALVWFEGANDCNSWAQEKCVHNTVTQLLLSAWREIHPKTSPPHTHTHTHKKERK